MYNESTDIAGTGGVKAERKESQLDIEIRGLHQVTEDIEHLVHELQVKLDPVLFVIPPRPEQEQEKMELPQTCSVGQQIRTAVKHICQSKEVLLGIVQNLDV